MATKIWTLTPAPSAKNPDNSGGYSFPPFVTRLQNRAFGGESFALGVNLLHSSMSADVHRTTRITRRFAELRDSGEMGVVAYITAGDPSFAATLKFVLAMAAAGADVIELGVPFSDPLADGPVIQRATERARAR